MTGKTVAGVVHRPKPILCDGGDPTRDNEPTETARNCPDSSGLRNVA
jgi:hypothetical protein